MLAASIRRGTLLTSVFALTSVGMRSINFLFLPFFLHYVSIELFGIWDFYQLIFVHASLILANVGIHALNRFYGAYPEHSPEQHAVISHACIFILASSAIALACLLFGMQIMHIKATTPLFLTTCCTMIYTIFSFMIAYMRLTENLIQYAVYFSAQTIIFIAVTLIGLQCHLGMNAFFFGMLASTCIVIPSFITMLYTYKTWDRTILYKQLTYSAPLMLQTAIYCAFFSADRFMLKSLGTPTDLGIYALLWRFGSLFQLAAFSLYDAWPILLFKQHHSQEEITSLTRYYALALCTAGLGTLALSSIISSYFFAHGIMLCTFLPMFVCMLVVLELSRLSQTGFLYAQKTTYIPWITLCCMIIQCTTIYLLADYLSLSIPMLIGSNIFSYGIYGIASAYLSKRITNNHYFSWQHIHIFCLFMLAISFITFAHGRWEAACIALLAWPILIWKCVIIDEEKNAFIQFLADYKIRF